MKNKLVLLILFSCNSFAMIRFVKVVKRCCSFEADKSRVESFCKRMNNLRLTGNCYWSHQVARATTYQRLLELAQEAYRTDMPVLVRPKTAQDRKEAQELIADLQSKADKTK